MKYLNKKGSISLAIILFIEIMIISAQLLSLASTQRTTVKRHSKQLENVYIYSALSEIVARGVQNSFKQYQVSTPKTILSDINIYQELSQDLRGKFIVGIDEYILYNSNQIIQDNMPADTNSMELITKILRDPTVKIQIHVEELFSPNLHSSENIFNFTNGDKIQYNPYKIKISISGKSINLIRIWEVRGLYSDIIITNDKIILKPNFSGIVMRLQETLYS